MFSSKLNQQTGNEKIRILKLETLSTPQLKRRRSHSHNCTDLSISDLFNSNQPIYLQSLNESSTNETLQHKSIISSSNSPYLSNQIIKDKHKKETHNRVERKRRDFINCQIQKLAELLPTEFFLNCDIKMNKGVILKNSVEYITSMKFVEHINSQLIQENDLGAKLIRTLISSNDLNCSQLSINDNFSDVELNEETNLGDLINQWFTVHQENKKLIQQFTQKLSQDKTNNFGDVLMENVFINDNKNNNNNNVTNTNNIVNTDIPFRKRYSSLPTSISPDQNSQGSQNLNVQFISDKSSSILNSLLKKPSHHNFTHNETLEPLYRIDSNDGVDFYVRYSASPNNGESLNTNNALIIDASNPESIKECKLIYSKNKSYYILPKPEPNFTVQLDNSSEESGINNLLQPGDSNDQFIQSDDPMLLSSSPTQQ